VACARRNLAPYGAAVHEGDLYRALPRRLRGRVDLVVASPPYVPTGEIRLLSSEARGFESPVALDGGPHGVDVVERIARGATQ
jgi:release factor glutamine methyltransferase